MKLSINTRQAYSEVDEFLGLVTEEEKNQIPKKLRNFFREERDINYHKNIDPSIPIKEQNLKEETLSIIALLMLQYWYKDEDKKQRLLEILDENERKYQEELREKYNPDNIFKKKSNTEEIERIEETALVNYENKTWYKKAIDFIGGLFKKAFKSNK